MTYTKCQVKGCTLERSIWRSFPNIKTDRERCLKWIVACGNPDLLQRLSNHHKICDGHFEGRYKLSKCLSKSAVPMLHLPDTHGLSSRTARELTQESAVTPG